jgi:hypothetical protein
MDVELFRQKRRTQKMKESDLWKMKDQEKKEKCERYAEGVELIVSSNDAEDVELIVRTNRD